MNQDGKTLVRIGIEVGEHTRDYAGFIKHIKDHYDMEKVDFVLITIKPFEMPEDIWLQWAGFFRETKTWFAFLYTQQRGAPEGKVSHLSRELVSKIKDVAGEYFIGDMIGETGGLCSWMEGYYDQLGIEKPHFNSLQEAKDNYVEHVCERVEIDRQFELPAVLAVEATTLSRYNFQAGVDYTFIEMMCGNPEIVFASARGASKASGRKWWASHIAHEWYGGFRNDDPIKYKRLELAYYMSYMAGAQYIYPESGDLQIASYGYDYKADSEFCKAYRKIWSDFADFVHLHSRPVGGPKVKIGFIQGNLDAWTGWGGSTVWNRFGSEDWVYGDAEYSWNILDELNKGEKWHVPTVYGDKDYSWQAPCGLYDLVPAEAPVEVLKNYDCLYFIGWNTMTEDIYSRLSQYVFDGGRLFMSAAHLNMSDTREHQWIPVKGGDISELFGCRLKGPGARLNCGVKFVKESIIPGCKYPVTRDGNCDPIFSGGKIGSLDIELTNGTAVAVLGDRFFGMMPDTSPILVEKAYGRGYASLVTSSDYPGSRGLEKLYKALIRASLAGEMEREAMRITGSSKLYFSIFEGGGKEKTIYLLNTDYTNSVYASISYAEHSILLPLKSCEMVIAYIDGTNVCIPESRSIFVDKMSATAGKLELELTGRSGDENIRLYTSSKPLEILADGRPIPFNAASDSLTTFCINADGYCKVEVFYNQR